MLIARALMRNFTLRTVDLSQNNLTTHVAEQLGEDYRIVGHIYIYLYI